MVERDSIMNKELNNDILRKQIIKKLNEEKWLDGKECLNDKRYMECVYDIMNNEKFKEMNNYIQHGTTTTLEHCISVSYISYKICKYYNFDYISAARGGLLHDLFLYNWHTHCKETGKNIHGLTQPRTALNNAKKYFDLNDVERDIILKHMWPLTVIPPKHMEGYVVMYADKYCGFIETIERIKNNMMRFDTTIKIH